MTPAEAQAAFDNARARFGDVLMDPTSTERDYDRAKEVLSQAEKVLRGVPHSLLGV